MTDDLFARHTQKAFEWVNYLNDFLGWEQKSHALDALRVVLHEIRNHLPLIEAVHLSAQLPLVLRGVYFEGWKLTRVPVKEKRKEDFIRTVRAELEKYIRCPFDDLETTRVIRGVFKTILYYIDEREMDKLCGILPAGIREFIP